MLKAADTMAEAVKDGPHSFQHIRNKTGLRLTDLQLKAIVQGDPGRFKLVRFSKRDDEGKPIRPGRPGVKLVTV
jgi:hypothetical protein